MLPVLDDMLSNDRARAEGRGQSSKAEYPSADIRICRTYGCVLHFKMRKNNLKMGLWDYNLLYETHVRCHLLPIFWLANLESRCWKMEQQRPQINLREQLYRNPVHHVPRSVISCILCNLAAVTLRNEFPFTNPRVWPTEISY